TRLFPDVPILHITDDGPVDFDDPAAWAFWIAAIRRVYSVGPDLVFSSEPYGEELARRLGAAHLPGNPARQTRPISATPVTHNPLAHWEFIPPCVRPYYIKRVAIVGAESTGKTTLAAALADHYRTVWVPEFARGYLEARGGVCRLEDIAPIAEGQT